MTSGVYGTRRFAARPSVGGWRNSSVLKYPTIQAPRCIDNFNVPPLDVDAFSLRLSPHPSFEIGGPFPKFHVLGREDEVPPKVRRRFIRKPQVFKFIERQFHFVLPQTLIEAVYRCTIETRRGQ